MLGRINIKDFHLLPDPSTIPTSSQLFNKPINQFIILYFLNFSYRIPILSRELSTSAKMKFLLITAVALLSTMVAAGGSPDADGGPKASYIPEASYKNPDIPKASDIPKNTKPE